MPIPTEITLKSAGTPAAERFNYTGMHRYLLTLPAHGPAAPFSGREIVTSVLDILRDASWRHHFEVYAYCFLPDRLLLIIRGKEETSQMKPFLREFRASSDGALSSKLGRPLWSKKYLERVLRKTEITSEAARAVFTTPVKLGLAPTPREYPYQGSFVRDPNLLFGPAELPPKPGQSRPVPSRHGRPQRAGFRSGPPGKKRGGERPAKPKGKARR